MTKATQAFSIAVCASRVSCLQCNCLLAEQLFCCLWSTKFKQTICVKKNVENCCNSGWSADVASRCCWPGGYWYLSTTPRCTFWWLLPLGGASGWPSLAWLQTWIWNRRMWISILSCLAAKSCSVPCRLLPMFQFILRCTTVARVATCTTSTLAMPTVGWGSSFFCFVQGLLSDWREGRGM